MDTFASLNHHIAALLVDIDKVRRTHKRIIAALKSAAPSGGDRMEWIAKKLNRS